MKKLVFAAVVMLAVISTGCASRVADFTIASTKNVEVSRIDLRTVALTRNVEDTDGRFWFLFIPFNSSPKIKEAMDRCLEKGNGDFMTNAVVYQTRWSLLLFSYGSYTVKGDVGNSLAAAPVLPERSLR